MSLRENILQQIAEELTKAEYKFPPFNSAHEGYAVILEELDELWEEIKNNKHPQSHVRQRKEAIQVGAMAARFVLMIDTKWEDDSHD